MSERAHIFRYGSAVIAPRVFDDLSMRGLFTMRCLSLLGRPCGPEEIKRRQRFFRELEDGDSLSVARQIERALADHLAARRLLHERTSGLVLLYRRILAAKRYVSLCETLLTASERFGVFADLAGSQDSCLCADSTQKALGLIEKIDVLLSGISAFDISVTDKTYIAAPGTGEPVASELSRIACSLGYGTEERTGGTLATPDSGLSDAVRRLYGGQILKIEELLADESLDCRTDFEPLFDELSVAVEITLLMQRMKERGIPVTYPSVTDMPGYVAKDVYHPALAASGAVVVPNDADIAGDDRVFCLLGANGGGKTTYLQALGANLVLFLSGCPVLAKEASIYPYSLILTHFAGRESEGYSGRFDEETERMKECFGTAEDYPGRCFWLINEAFSGTSEAKGVKTLYGTLRQVSDQGDCAVCVTHFSSFADKEFGVLAAEAEEDAGGGASRTYRIVRRNRFGGVYARDILKKYRLDRDSLKERRSEK